MPIRLYGVSSSGVKRKKLLSVLLSSKMPLVIHQLSVLNRDHCRVLVWSWVEHQTQSPTLVLKRQLTLWTSTFNVCMFIIISLWFDIFHMLQSLLWLIKCKCQFIGFFYYFLIRKSWISMSQILVLIYQGLYKNHSFIIRRSWDLIHINVKFSQKKRKTIRSIIFVGGFRYAVAMLLNAGLI
jgi:hypothetical protein